MFINLMPRLRGLGTDVDPLWSAAALSVWLSTVCNATLWVALFKLPDVAGLRGTGLIVGLWLAIAATLFMVQALFAGRNSTKILGCVLLLVSAPSMYFMRTYGVVIDVTMLKNTLQTDVKEAGDLMSAGLTATVLLVAVLPCAWLILRSHSRIAMTRRLGRNLVGALLAVIIAAGSVFAIKGDLATLMRNHTKLRYMITPHNVLYGATRLAIGEANPLPFVSLGAATVAASQASTVPVLVLVVGETARSDHFALNGYSKPTNPALQNRGDVISFSRVTSCGTNTADSVPCMFSHLGREAFFSRKANYDNALDVLQAAGYSVLWLDNNSGCKGVCARIPNENLSLSKHPSHCTGQSCFDEILSADLSSRIQAMHAAKPDSAGVVVVMHQLGSHGPAYYKRSPASSKPFTPECTTNVLQNCEAAHIANAYDNSIVYTDRLLSGIIDALTTLSDRFAPAMIYLSDHGESLGEAGTYLHGLPYSIAPQAQKHIPLIMWFSPAAQQQSRLQISCLMSRKNSALSHDDLFHSLLSWGGVQHAAYKSERDWFKPCRQ